MSPGERAYTHYREAFADRGCEIEQHWLGLEEWEREAWETLADRMFSPAVARIVDTHPDGRLATVEFIYNPVPVGTELYWKEQP